MLSCATSFGFGTVEMLDIGSGERKNVHDINGPKGCASSNKLGLYAIASYGGRCAVILSHGALERIHAVKHQHGVYSVAFANTRPLVVSGDGAGVIKVTSTDTWSLVSEFKPHTNIINALFLSPDDEVVLSASADTTAAMTPLTIDCSAMSIKGHTDSVTSVLLLLGGMTIVTGSAGLFHFLDSRCQLHFPSQPQTAPSECGIASRVSCV